MQGINSAVLVLNIKPLYHKWASLDLTFDVFYISGILNNSKKSNLPTSLRVFQNYPNPFNPNTMISFSLARNENVRLEVFNLQGRSVVKLIDESLYSGKHSVHFNARNLSSGVYFYKLSTSSFIKTKKMLLIK